MISSSIKTLSFAAVLCVVSATSLAASSTGPTVPTQPADPPSAQDVRPTINSDSKIHNDADIPTHPSVDPRVQGNDPGRQGGMNTDGNGPIGSDDDTSAPATTPAIPKP